MTICTRSSFYNDPNKGAFRCAGFDYDISLTDQSYNFSTKKLVENFQATGRSLQAISCSRYAFSDGRDTGQKVNIFDSVYPADISDVAKAARSFSPSAGEVRSADAERSDKEEGRNEVADGEKNSASNAESK